MLDTLADSIGGDSLGITSVLWDYYWPLPIFPASYGLGRNDDTIRVALSYGFGVLCICFVI
jgi:hypothetical protein